jgi:hypothetical protein
MIWQRFLAVLVLPALKRLGPVLLALPLVGLSGCSRIMGTKHEAQPVPSYPDGAAGLQQLFTDVLKAGQDDDRDRVHELFQSLKMTRPELDRLFGARASELASPYEQMMSSLMNRGAVELVALIYEKKYDEVEVRPLPLEVPLAGGGTLGPGERVYGPMPRADEAALARNLVERPPLYTVGLRKRGAIGGSRYNFFFYIDGHWRTGNELGKLLARRDDLTGSAPPR